MKKKTAKKKKSKTKEEMTAIKEKAIDLMKANPTLPISQVAKNKGVSAGTVTKWYNEMKKREIADVELDKKEDDKESSSGLRQTINQDEGGDKTMELTTTYMENLPSPSYKTRQFTRTIKETLPDDIDKEGLLARADKQQKVCEALVKNDIARTIEDEQ